MQQSDSSPTVRHNAHLVGGGGPRPSNGIARLMVALGRHGADPTVARVVATLLASLVGQADATENVVRLLACPGAGAVGLLAATLRLHPSHESAAVR